MRHSSSRFAFCARCLFTLMLLVQVISWAPVAAATANPRQPDGWTPAPTPGAQPDKSRLRIPRAALACPSPPTGRPRAPKTMCCSRTRIRRLKMYVLVIAADSARKKPSPARGRSSLRNSKTVRQANVHPTRSARDRRDCFDHLRCGQSARRSGRLSTGLKDQVYLILIDGSLDAVARRVSQVQVVGSGLHDQGGSKKPTCLWPGPRPVTLELAG